MVKRNSVMRWAVVGTGWLAQDFALPAIELSSNGCVAALIDRNPEALAKASAQYPEARVSADLDNVLAQGDIDAVYIATPNHAHAGPTIAALRAGVPVLCEKPMAASLSDVQAMVTAARQTGTLLATAFDQRFHPAHIRIRELVAQGDFGDVTLVRIHYACWLPAQWSPWAGRPHDNWRIDPARAGGGAVIDLAPHGIDLAQTLVESPMLKLQALLQRRIHDYRSDQPVDDGGVLIGSLENETLVQLAVAYNCPDALPRRRLEVIGTRASLVAENTMGQTAGGTLTRFDADTGEAATIDFDIDSSPFVAQFEVFADAVAGTRPFPFAIERDLRSHELLESACR